MYRIATSSLIAACVSAQVLAADGWVVWSQPQNTNWATVPSYAAPTSAYDVEVGDDIEIYGSIDRIVANGYDCFNCAPADIVGVALRLYEWTPSGPGALIDEIVLDAGDPNLQLSVAGPGTIDMTLPQPFTARGKHFFSLQLLVGESGSWDWWISNLNAPNGSPALRRDRTKGPDAPWEPITDIFGPLNADVSFLVWGTDSNPPTPGSDPCGTWTVSASPNPAGTDHAILRDVVALAPDDAWAVGEYTALEQGSYQTYTLVEHFDGATWSVIPSPNPTACSTCTYATFDAVRANGPNQIWAAGGKRVQSSDGFLGTHVFVARYDITNGNGSWTVLNTPLTVGGSGANIRDIEIVADDDIWFFGDWIGSIPGGPSGAPALAMHWNGSTFTVVPTPYPAFGTPGWGLEAGSALGPNDIWAVGGGSDGDYSSKTYIIHWDGSSWTQTPAPSPGMNHRLWAVEAIAPDDVWAVGDYYDANGYFSLFLHWDGATWSQVPSPGGGSSLVAFASDHVYAGGAGIVHWDGSSWQTVESFSGVIGPSVTALAASDLCHVWGVGRQIVAGDLLTFAARLHPIEVGQFSVAGDLDGDGDVNGADLGILLASWGPCPRGCNADFDGDGAVGAADLGILLGAWGG